MPQTKLSEKLSDILSALKDLFGRLLGYFKSCEEIKQDYQQASQIADQIIQLLEDFRRQAPLYRELKEESK